MKKFLAGLVLGIVIAVAGLWYYGKKTSESESVKDQLQNTATQTKNLVSNGIDSLNLSTEAIKDELAKTGQVVRRKAENLGKTISDAASDTRITGTIKAKLVANPDLSALSISVTTTDGRVTLSGNVSSADKIAEAIKLAMSVDGVKEVDSTLQVKN